MLIHCNHDNVAEYLWDQNDNFYYNLAKRGGCYLGDISNQIATLNTTID